MEPRSDPTQRQSDEPERDDHEKEPHEGTWIGPEENPASGEEL